MISRGAPVEDIEALLADIETTEIGLAPNGERARHIAELLVQLDREQHDKNNRP